MRKLKAHQLNLPDNEKVLAVVMTTVTMVSVQMTALHWSAYNNTTDNVRLLLKAVSSDNPHFPLHPSPHSLHVLGC